ncbi:MAG: hypothetical protein IT233_08975 [Bacteroidia bacterium]|nr:hypothetical protein [Bacteroidia bacterium]
MLYHPFDTNKYECGSVIDLGSHIFTDEEIIDFARRFDPLPFHTSKEAAAESIFKGLISSGPHPFNHFHTRKWLPLFGKTVLCGLEVSHWKFLKPTYAGDQIFCKASIEELRVNPGKNHAVISWHYAMSNKNGEMVQSLLSKIMHYYRK